MDLGFESLTETQERAVEAGLFDGKSLLVDAPTNTGKTFIGELAALNASKQREHRRSFFLVPLRALAEQMFNDLVARAQKFTCSGNVRICISSVQVTCRFLRGFSCQQHPKSRCRSL